MLVIIDKGLLECKSMFMQNTHSLLLLKEPICRKLNNYFTLIYYHFLVIGLENDIFLEKYTRQV